MSEKEPPIPGPRPAGQETGESQRGMRQGKRLPVFSYERCKACGICTHFCPQGALEEGEDGYPELSDSDICSSCRLCEKMCPDFAVSMVTEYHDLVERGGADPSSAGRREREEDAEACHLFDPCEE